MSYMVVKIKVQLVNGTKKKWKSQNVKAVMKGVVINNNKIHLIFYGSIPKKVNYLYS